jgi:hypothetical protein
MLDDKNATDMVLGARRQRVGISRRNLLGSAMIVAGDAAVLAAAVAAARAEAEAGKVTQTTAGYQASPKNGQRCMDCRYFKEPLSCNLVSGTISRAGWCKFYSKKS